MLPDWKSLQPSDAVLDGVDLYALLSKWTDFPLRQKVARLLQRPPFQVGDSVDLATQAALTVLLPHEEDVPALE